MILSAARRDAERLGYATWGSGEILLAIAAHGAFGQEEKRALNSAGLTAGAVERVLIELFPPKGEEHSGPLVAAPAVRDVIAHAVRLAQWRGRERADVEELLLAVLWEQNGVAGAIAHKLGLTYEAVYEMVVGTKPCADVTPAPAQATEYGPPIYVDKEDASRVLATLPLLLPPNAKYVFNEDEETNRFWFRAAKGINLEDFVRRALTPE